jgi:hypothetical protein
MGRTTLSRRHLSKTFPLSVTTSSRKTKQGLVEWGRSRPLPSRSVFRSLKGFRPGKVDSGCLLPSLPPDGHQAVLPMQVYIT